MGIKMPIDAIRDFFDFSSSLGVWERLGNSQVLGRLILWFILHLTWFSVPHRRDNVNGTWFQSLIISIFVIYSLNYKIYIRCLLYAVGTVVANRSHHRSQAVYLLEQRVPTQAAHWNHQRSFTTGRCLAPLPSQSHISLVWEGAQSSAFLKHSSGKSGVQSGLWTPGPKGWTTCKVMWVGTVRIAASGTDSKAWGRQWADQVHGPLFPWQPAFLEHHAHHGEIKNGGYRVYMSELCSIITTHVSVTLCPDAVS